MAIAVVSRNAGALEVPDGRSSQVARNALDASRLGGRPPGADDATND
jgi:hypothetical protein